MSVINIDFEQAKTLLSEVVEEAGEDFVYEGECLYAKNGQPSCIVGKVLSKAGVDVGTLRKMDHPFTWGVSDDDGEPIFVTTEFPRVVGSHVFDDKFTVAPMALSFLTAAQQSQDLREAWGTAQEAALAVWPDAT